MAVSENLAGGAARGTKQLAISMPSAQAAKKEQKVNLIVVVPISISARDQRQQTVWLAAAEELKTKLY
jgi:DNA-binding cell septation regulator SpoVG